MDKKVLIIIILAIVVIALAGVVLLVPKFQAPVTSVQPNLNLQNSDMIIGKYFEPHGAEHYIILNADGTFIHNRINQSDGTAKLVSGKFFISGSQVKFIYDDNYPELDLQISKQDIQGVVGDIEYFFVKDTLPLNSQNK